MPTGGLVNSDTYIFKSFLFSVPSVFMHSGPGSYQGLTRFLAVIGQLGLCFSRTWGRGINSMTLAR